MSSRVVGVVVGVVDASAAVFVVVALEVDLGADVAVVTAALPRVIFLLSLILLFLTHFMHMQQPFSDT